jgi:amino acid adenylation domain-containing protein
MFVNWFIKSSKKHPDRPCVEVNNEQMTYREMGRLSSKIAAEIQRRQLTSCPIGLLAYRSFNSYAGILGIMYSQNIYLPLNPNFPLARTRKMIEMVTCRVLIVGNECVDYLLKLLPQISHPMTIVFPDTAEADGISAVEGHTFIFSTALKETAELGEINDIAEEAVAYFVFTSGSTGEPKIVQQTNRNVITYLDYVSKRYDLDEHDRVSQTFELTFDNSIHDMFICWKYGACLYCIPRNQLMLPAAYIKDKQLTVWYSVPSIGLSMLRLNRLKPGSLPSLRYTLFCGEALPKTLAIAWAKAANHSKIENYYGITETTHQVSVYQWDGDNSEAECVNDIAPIGKIFDNLKYCILDRQRQEVPRGEPGELYVSGVQVTREYFNDPERTRAAYVQISHPGDDVWFKTGDLVKERENGNLNYLGRLDNQVQILGNRVELQEVDCILKKASGSEMVISLAWPIRDGIAEKIVAFIAECDEQKRPQILDYCQQALPPYMVPHEIFIIDTIPLNDNGKFDKQQLIQMLESSP